MLSSAPSAAFPFGLTPAALLTTPSATSSSSTATSTTTAAATPTSVPAAQAGTPTPPPAQSTTPSSMAAAASATDLDSLMSSLFGARGKHYSDLFVRLYLFITPFVCVLVPTPTLFSRSRMWLCFFAVLTFSCSCAHAVVQSQNEIDLAALRLLKESHLVEIGL